MPMVNGLIVPTLFERVYNARRKYWAAFRRQPNAETGRAFMRADAIYSKRYGNVERALRLMARKQSAN